MYIYFFYSNLLFVIVVVKNIFIYIYIIYKAKSLKSYKSGMLPPILLCNQFLCGMIFLQAFIYKTFVSHLRFNLNFKLKESPLKVPQLFQHSSLSFARQVAIDLYERHR